MNSTVAYKTAAVGNTKFYSKNVKVHCRLGMSGASRSPSLT